MSGIGRKYLLFIIYVIIWLYWPNYRTPPPPTIFAAKRFCCRFWQRRMNVINPPENDNTLDWRHVVRLNLNIKGVTGCCEWICNSICASKLVFCLCVSHLMYFVNYNKECVTKNLGFLLWIHLLSQLWWKNRRNCGDALKMIYQIFICFFLCISLFYYTLKIVYAKVYTLNL